MMWALPCSKSFAVSRASRHFAPGVNSLVSKSLIHRPRSFFHSTTFSKLSSTSESMINTLETNLDWDDRIGLQDRFSLEEKGWKVDVDWRATPYGAGLFSKQDIPAGTLLRKGILGVNLKGFASSDEIYEFCESDQAEPAEFTARLEYVKDYLWGFSKQADERGYAISDSPKDNGDDRFFGMWIPGNGLNHNEVPNTVYKATPEGIDLVALVDIQKDDELFDDYRRHGTSSQWLKDFAIKHNVTLNFADCNEFV